MWYNQDNKKIIPYYTLLSEAEQFTKSQKGADNMKYTKFFRGGGTHYSANSRSLKKLWPALILSFFCAVTVFCAFFIPFNRENKTAKAETNSVTYTAPTIKSYSLGAAGQDPNTSSPVRYAAIGNESALGDYSSDYQTGINGKKVTTSSEMSYVWRTTYLGVKASIVVPAYTEYEVKFTIDLEIEKIMASGTSGNRAGIVLLYYGNDYDDPSAGDKINLCEFAGAEHSKISFTDGNLAQYELKYIENGADHTTFGNPDTDTVTQTVTYSNPGAVAKTYNAYFGHLGYMDSTESSGSRLSAYYASTTFSESIKETKLSITRPTADTAVYRYTGQAQTYTPNGWDATKMKLATDSASLSQIEVGTYTIKVIPLTYPWDDDGSGFDSDPIEFTFEIIKGTPTTKPKYTLPNPNYVSCGLPTMTNDGTPGTYSWGEQQAQAGEKSYQWLFTPNDTAHYETATGSITFTFVEPSISKIEVTAYNPPATGVYTSATETDLKGYLTVTATYADGTDSALTNYKLSIGGGKLVAGSNTLTITTTDGGKFCKYTINDVIAVEIDDILTADLSDYDFTYPVTAEEIKARLSNVLVSYNNGTTGTLSSYDDVTISGTFGAGNNIPLSIGISGTAINYTDTKINIAKGTFDLSGITLSNDTVDYDGQAHGIEIAGALPDGVSAVYNYACAANGYNSADKPVNAGEYTVTVSFTHENANYNAITQTFSATLTINKIAYPDADKIKFENKTVTVGGTHSIEAENVPEGVTVSYEGNGQTELGTYTITAMFTHTNPNYTNIADKTATLTITDKKVYDKSGLGITVNGGEELSLEYTGEAVVIAATGEVKLTDGTAAEGITTEITITKDGEIVSEVKDAGTYTVQVKYKGSNEEYEPEFIKSYTVVIRGVYDLDGITFEDLTVEYDKAEHSIQISGTLPEGVTVTYEGSGTEVGEYIITAKFSSDDPNYSEIPDKEAKLIITKRKVTLVIDPLSSVVGEELVALTATVTEGSVLEGDTPYKLVCTPDKDAVGEYPVTWQYEEGYGDKYEITCEDGVYIVSKKADDPNGGGEIDMPVDISADFKVIQTDTKKEYDLKGITSGYFAELWYKNEDDTLGDEFVDEMNCILTLKVPDDIVQAISAEGELTKEKIVEKLKVYYIDEDGDAMPVKNYTLVRRADESWAVKFNYDGKFKAEIVFNAPDVQPIEDIQPSDGKIPTWIFIAVGAGIGLLLLILTIVLLARRRTANDYDDEYDYDEDDDDEDDYDDYDDYDGDY